MLSSALIGCFTVLLNVELCSDWLFHSAAHQQEGNTGRKIYFLNTFSHSYIVVIILYIKRGHQRAVINTRGIETAFERSVDRVIVSLSRDALHKLCLYYGATVLTTFHKIRRLSEVLRICKSFSIILISPYSVYVLSEILCTVTGYS